jgi:hypothetical protein
MVRLRHDEMYRQLMAVHHETVDTFVDELLDGAAESTAAEVALFEVSSGNWAGGGGGEDGGEGEGEDVVRDLVASTVLPGVEREMARQQAAAQHRQYVDAAASSVNSVVGGVQDADDDDE